MRFNVLLAICSLCVPLFQAALPQSHFPRTSDDAAKQCESRRLLADEREKQATKRGLAAVDESKILRAQSDIFSEIELLLKGKEAFERDLAALPARREAAEAARTRETELSKQPAAPGDSNITEATLAQLQSSIERERAKLYEIESQLVIFERLAAGGAFADRERVRLEADEVERARRALAAGSTAFGPVAASLENERIELASELHREFITLLDRREAAVSQFISILRLERDAKELELARRTREYNTNFEVHKNAVERELAAARAAEANFRELVQKAPNARTRALAALDKRIAELSVRAWEDRYKSLSTAVDRTLSDQLAEERLRLQTLKGQLEADVATGSDGWNETHRAIRDLLDSKYVKDLADELSDLKSLASRARNSAGQDVRDVARDFESGAPRGKDAAIEELKLEITKGTAQPAALDAFESEFNIKVANVKEAASARSRAANRLADLANARATAIQRLFDILHEEEQLVRSRGLFIRVEREMSLNSLRAAAADAAIAARNAPVFFNELAENTKTFVSDTKNLPTILGGSGLLLLAAILLMIARKLALRFAASLPVTGNLTLVDRGKRLGVSIFRRMALTGFVVIAAVIGIRLAGGSPALVRAVDASVIVIIFVRLALAVSAALLRPDDSRLRLLPVDDATARYVSRIALLASMSVFAVAIPRNVLDAIGYGERNPGFMEILDHAERGLITLAIVLLFVRKSVLDNLVPTVRNHAYEIGRAVYLRFRAIALFCTIALFLAHLAGFQFLATFLESIALGGAVILLLAALGRGGAIEIWDEIIKRIHFGPAGTQLTNDRKAFLNTVVTSLISTGFAIGSYLAFVALLRVGVSELKAVDVGLVGGRRFNVSDVLYFVLFIAASVVLARWVRRAIELFAVANAKSGVGTRYAIAVTSSYLILVIGFFISLSAIGFEIRDFAIVLGAAGFGIGLGMQETASNFLCGLILLFTQPVKVGDEIESEGRTGTIIDITITTTRMLTAENHEILIPNRDIVGKRLVNHTGRDPHVRGAVRVDTAANAVPDRVREVLLATAKANPAVITIPPPQVVLLGYGEGTLGFELQFWTEVALRIQVESEIRFALFDALAAANIAIALPQREIRVKGPLEISGAASPSAPRT
ncbi:MAG: mechanosensitive ion channel domain-containing protein [Planctomycetota bacterium]